MAINPESLKNLRPGSLKGPRKRTIEFKEAVTNLLIFAGPKMVEWLDAVATGNGDPSKASPEKALDLTAKLAEYAAPKLARTEVAVSGTLNLRPLAAQSDAELMDQRHRLRIVGSGSD